MKAASSKQRRIRHINRIHGSLFGQGYRSPGLHDRHLGSPEPLESRRLLDASPLPLAAGDFTFLGTTAADVNRGYLSGLAYRPETNTFFTIGYAGQPSYDLLEIRVPTGGGSTTLVKDWGNLGSNGPLANSGTMLRMEGLYWDDPNQRLWISWGQYYNANHTNDACLAYLTLDTGTPVIHGPWSVPSSIGSDNVRGSIVAAPPSLQAITGQPFMSLAGKGNAAQDESWGESLVSLGDPSTVAAGGTVAAETIAKWPEQVTVSHDPVSGREIDAFHSDFPRLPADAIQYIYGNSDVNPPGTLSYENNVFVSESTMVPGDGLYQGVWIDTPQLSGLIYFGELSTGYAWYGNYNAHNDTSSQGVAHSNNLTSLVHSGQPLVDNGQQSRGDHADAWAWRAYFFSPQDMLNTATKVMAGTSTWTDVKIAPYSTTNMATLGGNVPVPYGNNQPTGIYFNSTSGVLYLVEPNNMILEWHVSATATPTPVSSVTPLPTFSPASFTVSWSGIDVNGTGIASYTIYVSDNGGAYVPFQVATTATSAHFSGLAGHIYTFYSVATDKWGSVESKPAAAEVTTTVPAGPPISSVTPLPANSPATFTVSWSGTDVGGPGIAKYDVYVSDNGGAFTAFVTATTNTSATFQGVFGHRYGFYSVATDKVLGEREATPAGAQATTLVADGPPKSSVAALPAQSLLSFLVSWSGSGTGGLGIASYDVYVSDNGGAFTRFIVATTATSTTFHAAAGHRYGFYSVATDSLGQHEAAPTSAEATTTVYDANALFVMAAYEDVLGRSVDAAGLTHWDQQLDAGLSREVIANQIDHSAEYFGKMIVAPAYQKYLGRVPDASGVAYWVDQMQNHGLTDERLEAGLIGSQEFFQKAGGTDQRWIDALYRDLLGRPSDPAGQAAWVAALATGMSRAEAAFGFTNSLERERSRATDDYMSFLGRQPDSQGLDYYVNQFANGLLSNEALITRFVASGEYFERHTN